MFVPGLIRFSELCCVSMLLGIAVGGLDIEPKAAAADGNAAAWTQFHGPDGSGIAAGDGAAPVDFGPDKNLLWRVDLPAGHSSPCVAGNRVFVTAYETEGKLLQTVCLNADTGEILWKRPVPAEQIEKHHEISNPATATPATDGKVVVSYFGSAGLFAYDVAGQELWTKRLPIAKTPREFGSGTSPIVAEGKVILDMHLEADSYLVAYDIMTSNEVWKTPRPLHNQGWSTPVNWREGDLGRVGMAAVGRFSAYDLADGQEVWWVDGVGNQVCATPVVKDDLIVITSAGVLGEPDNVIVPPAFDDFLAQHDRNKDGGISIDEIPDSVLVADRKSAGGAGNMTLKYMLQTFGGAGAKAASVAEWEQMRQSIAAFKDSDLNKTNVMAVRTGGTGDVTKSHVVWQEFRGVPEVPSPLVYRDRVWMIKTGGLLTCLALTDGKVMYQGRVGQVGGYYASPVASGGRIYVASDHGVVTVLEAKDKPTVLAQNQLPDAILATPAIADGTVLVRTTKQLLAFR
jgi:outer membrane protein assembly factor BamB